MSSPGDPRLQSATMSAVGPPSNPDDIDAETREDALDVLGDLLHWQLPPARWQQVASVLTELEIAWRARDAAAVREAVADLELSGPVRATRIGSAPTGASPDVKDRIDALVHSLGGRSEPAPERTPEDADDTR